MKKTLITTLLILCSKTAFAVDLIEIYQQALVSDPLFQQAISQRLATKEGVPIAAAAILPNLAFSGTASVTRSTVSGSNLQAIDNPVDNSVTLAPASNTQRAYGMTLTISQTIFNFAQFATVANAVALSKEADAALNAALQDLIVRVANAYFRVLNDEDNLTYSEASKLAFGEQLDQVKQQYAVGLKTVTEVYTAQAAYDSAVADFIAAQTQLANNKENLRIITGRYYEHVSSLNDDFPLVTPEPADIERWVSISLQQNWTIKASQYAVDAAREIIKQQMAGHLPILNLQGSVDKLYTHNLSSFPLLHDSNRPGTQVNKSLYLNLAVPIFSGGAIVAQTNQASYNFQATQQQLEQNVRQILGNTRQSYLNIISGISKVAADRQAVKSNISSLEGMEASYRVGTTTLVDVLNQQQKLFQAQLQYANDRYAYVANLLLLKQAAGTLSFDDLKTLNNWLIDAPASQVNKKLIKRIVLGQEKPKSLKKTKQTKRLKIIHNITEFPTSENTPATPTNPSVQNVARLT